MKGKTFLCFSFRISVESTIRKISKSTNNSSNVENHSSETIVRRCYVQKQVKIRANE